MLALAWPSAVQIWRVNAATEVFPLVPVTAAITCGWRGKRVAAARANVRRASSTLMNGTLAGSAIGGGRSAMTAAAPAASACGKNSSPSAFAPATATNRSPGLMLRLSALTPATSSAARRASLTASAGRRSASFMVRRIVYLRRPISSRESGDLDAGFPYVPGGSALSAGGARQDQLVGGRQ